MRLVVLGGGGFRVPLVHAALMARPSLQVRELVLHDADPNRLAVIAAVLAARGGGPAIRAETDLPRALRGADVVFSAIRVGGAAARARDERRALDAGVLGQETVGLAGLSYGLRTLPVVLDIARVVADVAPRAWFVNFTNPAGMITMAREQGDGTWILNGAKMWITNGSTAKVAVVWAKTNDDADASSIRGFLVPTDAKGFTAKDQKGKLSLRASDTSELVFSDVHLPADAILPGSGGLKSPLMCLTQARFGISWGAVGAAMACFEEASSYAKNRVMFDRPSGGFQIQQQRLAEMLTGIVQGQLLSLHLGRLKDAGTMTPQQVSLAKRSNVSMATDVAREARRLLGAVGVLAEYAAMRHMANLESVYTYEGTHDVHSLVLGQAITGLSAFN